jgi:ribose/xylose/arabinose/galactoside ABC-type transport system permease subunit
MGVIFKRTAAADAYTAAIENAIQAQLRTALHEQAPNAPEVANARVAELARPAALAAASLGAQQAGTVGIKVAPFLITLGLFFALLGLTIWLDWAKIVQDPKVYSGMVTTALGALIGFLGGDAAGTGSST